MGDIRRRPFRPAPNLVPEDLIGMAVPCPICSTSNIVPWLERLTFPKQPIARNAGGGYFVPVSFPIVCASDSCKNSFDFKIPVGDIETIWNLYGDEAGRFIKSPLQRYSSASLNFFCITLVGLHKSKHDEFRRNRPGNTRSLANGVSYPARSVLA